MTLRDRALIRQDAAFLKNTARSGASGMDKVEAYERLMDELPDLADALGRAEAERDALKAATDRVRAKHAELHAEIDAFEAGHNPECECDYGRATRMAADRMLEALDHPTDTTGETP